MKSITAVLVALLLAIIGYIPSALAGDKTFACHITSEYLDGDGQERLGGHVISISEASVDAHCTHGGVSDHYPIGVAADAVEFCDDLDLNDKAYDKCLTNFAIGKFCSRRDGAVRPVTMLCGDG